MEHFILKPCLFMLKLMLLLALNPLSFAQKQALAQADSLQQAILNSEKLTPARLFSRDEFLSQRKSFSTRVFNANTGTKKIAAVKLSPDGKYLAFLVIQGVDKGVKQQLWMLDISNHTASKLFSSSRINNIYWTKDSQGILLQMDSGVGVVDAVPKAKPSIILNLDRHKEQYFAGVDTGSPHHFYVWQQRVDTQTNSQQFELYRVSRYGQKQKLYSANKIAKEFMAPGGGPLRFLTESVGLNHKIHDLSSGKKREIYACYYTDYCSMLSYHQASNTLYLKGRGEGDLIGLLALDLSPGLTSSSAFKSGEYPVKAVHQDPQNRFDLDKVSFAANSLQPIMTSYHTDFYENVGLADGIKQHISTIKQQLNSSVINIEPAMGDKHWVVVDANPQKVQKQFYLYEPASGQLSQPLADFIDDSPTIKDEALAPRVAIQYQASDGMMLQGYLTLPRGQDVSRIPLVVNVHGGPFKRMAADNTTMAQFLANRGYGVFEPNFRGSEGFGRDYMLAAKRDFGDGRVQLDIDEGVKYLLSRGIGDKNRLAIMGGSFGGFAALTGLTFSPDLYQVGFAMAPGTALAKTAEFFVKQAKDSEKQQVSKVFADRMVDINDPADVKRSNDKSPLFNLANVTKPLYILAGQQDDKVSILNVRHYALQLAALGKNVTLLSAPQEGHIFRHPTAVEAKFYLLEQALHTHIGGKMQTSLNPKVERFIQKNTLIDSTSMHSTSKHSKSLNSVKKGISNVSAI